MLRAGRAVLRANRDNIVSSRWRRRRLLESGVAKRTC